jgi:hypothetical protein
LHQPSRRASAVGSNLISRLIAQEIKAQLYTL